jgi:hypothetical protein
VPATKTTVPHHLQRILADASPAAPFELSALLSEVTDAAHAERFGRCSSCGAAQSHGTDANPDSLFANLSNAQIESLARHFAWLR